MMETTIELLSNGNTVRGTLRYPDDNRQYPLIVLLSGYGGTGSNSSTWNYFEEQFFTRGNDDFCILKWDYTGQGNSDGDIKDLTPFLAVEELRKFMIAIKKLTYINLSRVGFYGSSFGGYVAMIYSAMYGGEKKLFLKSPVSDYAEVRENMLGDSGIENWRETGFLSMDDGSASSYNFYIQSKAIDVYNRICPLIKTDTLIVHGDSDTNVPVEQSKKLHECLVNSNLNIIEGANHGYKEGNSLELLTKKAVTFFLEGL